METVFTLTEVHSIPFLKTQDSLGLFTMCLLSVGPEVQRNFLYHKRHTRRMDAAGRWQGSQEGSHGDGDELQSTCALHRGQPLPSSADAGRVRKSTQGGWGDASGRQIFAFPREAGNPLFFIFFCMTFYKCQPLSPPFFFPRSIQPVCRQDWAHRSSCDLCI